MEARGPARTAGIASSSLFSERRAALLTLYPRLQGSIEETLLALGDGLSASEGDDGKTPPIKSEPTSRLIGKTLIL